MLPEPIHLRSVEYESTKIDDLCSLYSMNQAHLTQQILYVYVGFKTNKKHFFWS